MKFIFTCLRGNACWLKETSQSNDDITEWSEVRKRSSHIKTVGKDWSCRKMLVIGTRGLETYVLAPPLFPAVISA